MWSGRVIINRVDNVGVKKEKRKRSLLIEYNHEKRGFKVNCIETDRLANSKKCDVKERLLEIKEKFTRKTVLHDCEIIEID